MPKKSVWFVVVCAGLALAMPAYAEGKKGDGAQKQRPAMAKKSGGGGGQGQNRSVGGGGQKMPGRAGKRPGQGEGIPSRGREHMGSQGMREPIVTGGGHGQSANKPGGEKRRGPGDMSRSNQLKELANDRRGLEGAPQSGPFGGRQRGKAGITGQDGTPDVSRGTVQRGDGKNRSSRREQQSSGNPAQRFEAWDRQANQPVDDGDGNYMGTRGALSRDRDAQQTGGMEGQELRDHVKDNEEFQRAHVKDEAEARNTRDQQEKEMDQQAGNPPPAEKGSDTRGDYNPPPPGDDTVATPHPDAVDPAHAPQFLQDPSAPKKSMRQLEEERKRQVGMPGENSPHRDMRPEDIAATPADGIRRQTDGRITPVDGDGTTTSSGEGRDDLEVDPMTGQPKRGRKHGGGGDPAENE